MTDQMDTGYAKPLPLPDRDSTPYWEYLASHELRVQKCRDCGGYRWPARGVCNQCSSMDYDWVAVSGKGKVISWTVVHHQTAPGFGGDIPYNVAVVQLDESPELVVIGNVLADNDALRGGLPVSATFDDVAEGVTLVRWVPEDQS